MVTRSARRRTEQDAVVACENSQAPSGKVAKDQPVPSGAEQPTADCEVLAPETPTDITVTQTPTEPEREVTSVKGKAKEGGDLGLRATAEELKAWQQSDPTLEKARSLVSERPTEGERVYYYLQDGLLY